MAAVLTAVGEPNRLLLLRLLLGAERCVTQCVEHTGLVQSLVSKHLVPSGRRRTRPTATFWPAPRQEGQDVAAPDFR